MPQAASVDTFAALSAPTNRELAPRRDADVNALLATAQRGRVNLHVRVVAPVAALLFAGLTLAWVATASSTPGSRASGAAVIAFYNRDRQSQRLGDVLGALGIVFFLVFAGAFRSYLRRRRGTDAASAVMLAAAAVLAVGLALFTGIDYALGDAPGRLSTDAAQALNLLNQDLFFPALIGVATFALASGVAILSSRALPRWLGASALIIGVATLTPGARVAFLALIGWVAVTATMMCLDGDPTSTGWRTAAGPEADGEQQPCKLVGTPQ